MKAHVSEIFVSMQGEGKYLGQRQCFVRFYHCDLSCGFCDTKPASFKDYSAIELLAAVRQCIGRQDVRSISLTGGEPLLQRDFLIEFLPLLLKARLSPYLETSGILADELFDVLDYVDVIAMDIKLPSSTKMRPYWQEHKEFLSIANSKDVFVKTVICTETTVEDLMRAVQLVALINPAITFIIQPNTYQLGRDLAQKLQEFKRLAKEHLRDVRLIPQVHKLVGVQ